MNFSVSRTSPATSGLIITNINLEYLNWTYYIILESTYALIKLVYEPALYMVRNKKTAIRVIKTNYITSNPCLCVFPCECIWFLHHYLSSSPILCPPFSCQSKRCQKVGSRLPNSAKITLSTRGKAGESDWRTGLCHCLLIAKFSNCKNPAYGRQQISWHVSCVNVSRATCRVPHVSCHISLATLP